MLLPHVVWRVPQVAMAMLTQMFPELAPSIIIDTLGNANGDVKRAALALLSPAAVRRRHALLPRMPLFGWRVVKRRSTRNCQGAPARDAAAFALRGVCMGRARGTILL